MAAIILLEVYSTLQIEAAKDGRGVCEQVLLARIYNKELGRLL